MKILPARQTRALDQATLQAQRISSDALMERAATACTTWLLDELQPAFTTPLHILCGPGNNGGDGLAIARQLHAAGYSPQIWLLPSDRYSSDFLLNRQRLPPQVPCTELSADSLPALPAGAVVLDALFGTGLSRPLQGLAARVVQHLSQSGAVVVAIDVPSGLFADAPQPADSAVVRARYTLSFELPKLAFLLPQNAAFVGEWTVLPIGLDANFIHNEPVDNYFVDAGFLRRKLPRREKFSHKGTFGHALLLAGSYGKMGAAVLAAQACLRGGVGLLTVRIPAAGYDILQISAPEAMALPDPAREFLTELPELQPYAAVGMGPGLGQEAATAAVLRQLLHRTPHLPLVLDADALNLLATHRDLLALLPPDSLLTPHPKEFERLTGEPARDDYHRLEQLRAFCGQHRCYCVLKGAYTALGTPEGAVYFNSTGNPGMASGGSGDVLTGLLLALRADRRLSPLDAALLGVFAHGRAGDLAAAQTGEAGLVASDLVRFIGPALQELVDG
ncbi:bifunctional ADP-dependent NAD(P)H-hydrate dehydratase/NAD(P)H-hydrate epimerase [Hymenobacter psychrotolerans]|uniref:Bifunctional NAD(P)H-hydrate repair enzyme n=1 Tax=Hymenobacter psychrotolerans DSM 18569 TaxID=1121959 RepID=A0A1M6P7K4_9BACT|nr:bifunctional ADP-dependent NAD(P)H-hydrate dehydratase/NAD(P)H-hydrate epimerase [Hymenobacter psychrotolerans]SHK03896.1 NAD(P)H-hydrate epimerase [Hymenobacter psychrotolerans DSM 18569]